MRKSLLLLLILFFFGSFFGYNSYANNKKVDTAYVNQLVNKCKKKVFAYPKESASLIDSIFVLSEGLDYQAGMYNAMKYSGVLNFMLGEYQSSIDYYYKAFEYAKNDPEKEVVLLMNISLSHRTMVQYDSSFYILDKAGKLAEKNGLVKRHADIQLDLGHLYLNQEDYVNAAKYLLRATDLAAGYSESSYKIRAYSTLAMLYQNLHDFPKAQKYYKDAIKLEELEEAPLFLSTNYANYGELYLRVKSNFDSAIYYHRKSVEVAKPYEKAQKSLIANINIGSVYLEMHNIDSAYFYYLKASNDTLLDDYTKYQAAVYTNIGIYNHEKGNHQEAEYYLLKGLEISKEFGFLKFQQNAYHQLSQLEEANKNFKKSLEYHKLYKEIIIQIEDQEAKKEIAILDYEKYVISEKYENELLIQENENQSKRISFQNKMIIFGIFFFIILLVLLLLLSKKNKKINDLHKGLAKNYSAMEKVNKSLTVQNIEISEEIKSKHRFVSILGHDLKNPFTGLLGLLELINSDWDDMPDEEKQDGIRILYKSSLQTYKLLEELLEYGKAQQGLIVSNPEKFILLDLLNDIQGIFETSFSKKNIKLKYEINAALEVKTDRRLISQILQNFIGNAVKYSHKGGSVMIKVEEVGQAIKIHVIDYGIGIPNDKIDGLFRADLNFNRPGTDDEKSTGMGLILCKEYATIIEADIKVISTEGSGSCFSLILDKLV